MKILISSLLALLLMSGHALAESSQKIGNYIVHYNALPTEFLPAHVAKNYDIKRSKNRGFLNISVLKQGDNYEGVEAKVEVYIVNLVGQLRHLDMRKVTEKNAVYYISDFSVSHLERMTFKIKVTTAENRTIDIKLKHQFYTD